MYWAVLYHVEENLDSLIVYVVDFDGQVAPYIGANPIIGPMITQMTEEMVQVEPLNNIPHLGYVTRDAAAFDNDPLQVREAVYAQQAWAAIVINPNATALLQRAVELGNTSYDPTGACQLVWVEARDQDTMYDYVLPMLNTLETQISSKFGPMWAQQVLSNDSIPRATLAKVPQALNPGIGFSLYSLRPFVPAVTTPAVTIGLIYLIILAFFSFAFYLPIHMKFVKPEGHPPLHFYQMIIWRWLATITAYFFMSLAYSLISLAFQIPFDNPTASFTAAAEDPNAFGKGTFVVYWMINFVGMIALGLACENVAMIIGQPWTAMWLIFWVITNVSTAFYAIELSPRFYYWGYAWPLHVSFCLSLTSLSSQGSIALTQNRTSLKLLERCCSICTHASVSISAFFLRGLLLIPFCSGLAVILCGGRCSVGREKKPRRRIERDERYRKECLIHFSVWALLSVNSVRIRKIDDLRLILAVPD